MMIDYYRMYVMYLVIFRSMYYLIDGFFFMCTYKDFFLECLLFLTIYNGYYIGQYVDQFVAGLFVIYSCEFGYLFIGKKIIKCLFLGDWDGVISICKGILYLLFI